MRTAVDVVREYTNAFATRDVERMIALADPEIEIVTPRGTGRGHQEIRDFMERQTYGVSMHSELVRVLHRGETVVTEERVELRYVETGERAEAFTVASVYVVRDGRVVRLAPQSDFEAAVREAGLTGADEVALP